MYLANAQKKMDYVGSCLLLEHTVPRSLFKDTVSQPHRLNQGAGKNLARAQVRSC